jgi:uncharacterized phosphosugar-binding protein
VQQVKIFKSLESDIAELESDINTWIRQSGAKIVAITGNIAPQSQPASDKTGGLSKSPFPPSDVVIIVVYVTPSS